MFSFAAHSAVYFARRTAFTTLCKRARFLSVSAASSTKKFYSESVLFSEKPSKSAKAKKINDKKLEQSQLYPDELEKLHNYDFEEFDLLMDDKTPSVQKDPRSVWPESVARKSEAVDKMPPIQKDPRSGKPESVGGKSEAIEGLKISETEEIDLQENDLGERLSDSDSESEAEDCYGMRRRIKNNFPLNLSNLKIARLGRRSRFLREIIEKATSQRDDLILNDEINGIFALARLGITPETLFFSSSEALKYFPADLSNTALYIVPFEDMKYWSFRVRTRETSMIGIYNKETFKIKTGSSEPEMPLTIICDQIWHKLGFAQMLNSASVTQPKVFITSKDCVYPWNGVIVRNSFGQGILLNHDFGLIWEEIRQKVDENDKVYLLQVSLFKDEDEDESYWSSLPSVYLYDHSFWDSENITLIVRGHSKRVSQELSRFCSERNVLRIDTGMTKRPLGLAAFHMAFFELRRQWLAVESRNLSESGSKNGKTAKSRVRVVSTLFKTLMHSYRGRHLCPEIMRKSIETKSFILVDRRRRNC